ncbi:hypothetical protein FB45DRAFT_1030073 [Roridomyces roridus]|uniref:protein S-acyltransferase n=1 Tax=Roridomyces roridus TaxID=1738132 RepID=A0AAD7FKV3_9AGAR|nr:hypothetical protein FB45DRAFT_1030073 [Roridomyces roridus]
MDFQELVSTHPDLAPSILNVFSNSLKQEQAKVKDLESKLEASSAAKLELYELRIRQLQELNQQLEVKVDAQGQGRVKQEAAERTLDESQGMQSLHETIAKLEQEADGLRSELRDAKSTRDDLEASSSRYAELEARAARQQEEYDKRLSSAMQSYTSLRDDSTAEIKKIAGACEDLRGQLAQSLEKARVAEEHDSAIKKLKEKLSQVEEDSVKRLEDEMCKWKRKTGEYNAEIERLRMQTSGLEKEKTTLLSSLEAGSWKEKEWTRVHNEQRDEITRCKVQVEQFILQAKNCEEQHKADIETLKETLTKEHDEKLRQELGQQQQTHQAKLNQYKNHGAKLKKVGVKLSVFGRRTPETSIGTGRPQNQFEQRNNRNISATILSSVKSERELYTNAMNCGFPVPPTRPPLNTLHPIWKLGASLDLFQNPFPNPKRKSIHFPRRHVFTSPALVHSLVYAPAEEYWRAGTPSDGVDNIVYYIGTYAVHSLRFAHLPGSGVPQDVDPEAILRTIPANADGTRVMRAHGELKTECFGLQCTGFDQDLYKALRQRLEDAGEEEKGGRGRWGTPGKGTEDWMSAYCIFNWILILFCGKKMLPYEATRPSCFRTTIMDKCYFTSALPPELILLFASFLDTASLNALIQTCHHLYTVLDPEFQARITPELGKRILLWGSKESKPHIVSKLLAPPHLVNPNEAPESGLGGLTALHAAVKAGSTEIVAMLLAAGADPRSVLGMDNFQPLHLAVFDDRLDILGLLLDHETALHHACAVGRSKTVRVLLERGADTESVGEYGTALGYALRARHLEVMGMLLEHGAKAEAAVPLNGGWIRDGYGQTPPHKANLLYLAMGLTHPRGEDSPEPPSTEGRAEFMAMLLAYGASKEAAMKTVSEYLTPLADAADKTEEHFVEMVQVSSGMANAPLVDAALPPPHDDSPPRLPPELIQLIIENIRYELEALQRTSLVCRQWLPISRTYLFEHICLSAPRRDRPRTDCSVLCEVLTGAPYIAAYIRHVTLLAGPTWTTMLPLSIKWISHDETLPTLLDMLADVRPARVQSLHIRLTSESWSGLPEILQISIHRLINSPVMLDSPRRIKLSEIARAGDIGADAELTEQVGAAPWPESCESLTVLDTVYLPSVVSWAITIPTFHALRELRLGFHPLDDMPHVESLLNHVGETLESLHLQPIYSSWPTPANYINLSGLRNLTDLRLSLGISADSNPLPWTIFVLSTLGPNSLAHITIDLRVGGFDGEFHPSILFEYLPFAALDAALNQPHLAGDALRSLCFTCFAYRTPRARGRGFSGRVAAEAQSTVDWLKEALSSTEGLLPRSRARDVFEVHELRACNQQ